MARPVNDSDGSTTDSSGESLEVLTATESLAVQTPDAHRGRHAAPTAPRKRSPLRWVLEIVIVIVIAVGAAIAVRTFVMSPVSITTEAMANTLIPGDRVLVSQWPSNPQRGDVIAFEVPDAWVPASSDGQEGWAGPLRQALTFIGVATPDEDSVMVLRVIAVEGQRIACCTQDGQLELDGVPLVEPYLRPGVPTDQIVFDVVVPQGRVFVLGDDRATARDSRYHLAIDEGTIAMDDVTGRVFAIAWPFDRIRPVDVETGSAG